MLSSGVLSIFVGIKLCGKYTMYVMCIKYSQCTEEPLRMYPGIFCHLEVVHLHNPIFLKQKKTTKKKPQQQLSSIQSENCFNPLEI